MAHSCSWQVGAGLLPREVWTSSQLVAGFQEKVSIIGPGDSCVDF